MGDNGLPIEVGFERAKRELLQAINQIGKRYNLPSSLMTLIVQQLITESKLNTFEVIVANYDITLPKGAEDTPDQPLQNDDVHMKADDVK